MRRLIAVLALLTLAGCASVRYDAAPLLSAYEARVPEHISTLSSVTFSFGPQEITGIGMMELDPKSGEFAVSCMNLMGMKLFELQGSPKGVNTLFVLPMLDRGGGFGQKVGEDILRMYTGLAPSMDGAWAWRQGDEIVVVMPDGEGQMRYGFSALTGELSERAYFAGDDLKWRVAYFGYEGKNGKLYARGVTLYNYQYGYSLSVKIKEIID